MAQISVGMRFGTLIFGVDWGDGLALVPVIPAGCTLDTMHRLISFGDTPPAIFPRLMALGIASRAIAQAVACILRFG